MKYLTDCKLSQNLQIATLFVIVGCVFRVSRDRVCKPQVVGSNPTGGCYDKPSRPRGLRGPADGRQCGLRRVLARCYTA